MNTRQKKFLLLTVVMLIIGFTIAIAFSLTLQTFDIPREEYLVTDISYVSSGNWATLTHCIYSTNKGKVIATGDGCTAGVGDTIVKTDTFEESWTKR